MLVLCTHMLCAVETETKAKAKKKKDIRDYNDADMARLLEQWEASFPVHSLQMLAAVSRWLGVVSPAKSECLTDILVEVLGVTIRCRTLSSLQKD